MKKVLFFCLWAISYNIQAQNVGIGTVSPSEKLQVQGNIKLSDTLKARRVSIGTDSSKYPLAIQVVGSGFAQVSPNGSTAVGTYADNGSAYIQTHTNHDLYFATNNGSAQMTLQKGTGNVGIGIANPGEKLEVNGTTKTNGLQMPTSAGTGKVLTSDAGGNATWQPDVSAATSFVAGLPNQTYGVNAGAATIPFITSISGGFDNGNNYNNTGFVFTAPAAGMYHFNYTIPLILGNSFHAPTDGYMSLRCIVNNLNTAKIKEYNFNSGDMVPSTIGDVADIMLQAGDQVKIVLYNYMNLALPINALAGLTGRFIGYRVF